MKPKILITARICMNGSNPAYQVNQNYVNSIRNAGGIPFVVVPSSNEDLEAIADLADGLLISGGDDLDPSLYSDYRHDKVEDSDHDLDAMDLKLIKYFHKFNKPILGICRGLQSINVAFGGTLYQDLPSEYEKIRAEGHVQSDRKKNVEHLVYFNKDTYAHNVFGDHYGVNSFHHQGIKDLAKALTISGVSEDGLIEAVETSNLLAVQWHPERYDDDDNEAMIFIDFIKLCKDMS